MTSLERTANTIRGVLLQLADVQREVKAEALDFTMSIEILSAAPEITHHATTFEIQYDDKSSASQRGFIVGHIGLHVCQRDEIDNGPFHFRVERVPVWNLTSLPCGLRLCQLHTWRAAHDLALELEPFGDLSQLTSRQRDDVVAQLTHYAQWDEALRDHLPHYPYDLEQL